MKLKSEREKTRKISKCKMEIPNISTSRLVGGNNKTTYLCCRTMMGMLYEMMIFFYMSSVKKDFFWSFEVASIRLDVIES
jgi:hypothetical protein